MFEVILSSAKDMNEKSMKGNTKNFLKISLHEYV